MRTTHLTTAMMLTLSAGLMLASPSDALAQAGGRPAAGQAAGQPPLGGGRILDRGLSPTWGRVNTPTFDLQAMVRYNNAIVSGDATGGRSLRVPTGYSSTSSFGRSSTSISTFNRDAADWRVSVLAAQQGGGTIGSSSLDRGFLGAGMNLGPIGPNTTRISTGLDTAAMAARAAPSRSISSRADGRSGLLVGFNVNPEGRMSTVRASTLRGLISEPIDTRAGSAMLDLSASPRDEGQQIGADGRVIREPLRDRLTPVTGAVTGAGTGTGTGTNAGATPSDVNRQALRGTTAPGSSIASPRTAGDSIRQAFRDTARRDPITGQRPQRDRITPGPTETPDPTKAPARTDADIDLGLARLRARLLGQPEPTSLGAADAPADPRRLQPLPTMGAALTASRTSATPTPGGSAPATSAGGASAPATPERATDINESDVTVAVRNLQEMRVRIDELVPPGASITQAADGYLHLGQQLMRETRYLSADDAFSQVLLRRPDDLMARAGRTHASIATGMFLSGGVQLRHMLTDKPEMIPVKYDPMLVLGAARAEQTITALRTELQNPDSPIVRDGGLVLAYLGFQLENRAWLEEGLAQMDKTWTMPADRALLEVVDKVWRQAPATP